MSFRGIQRRQVVGLIIFLALIPAAAGGASTKAPLTVITEPNAGYAPIDSLLASAHHRLDLTIYELEDQNAEAILAADARRGVNVRVLLDRDYVGDANSPAFAYLAAHHVHVRWASSQVEITHEKSFVIDGRAAVIMTGNFTSRYYGSDRDFAVVDHDAADVAAIDHVFALDWANRSVTPGAGADLVWSPGSEQTLVDLIGSARHRLLVENEEMSAEPIVAALESAARRGVTVELVMTESSEWDEALDALSHAGVHVRTYAYDAPLYIHAKAISVDGRRVFLGSENFSTESLDYNRELGLITSAQSIVGPVTATLGADYARARPWW
jgi:cardiolipin synthase A/B